ncbi:response regulator, partial [Oxalobacteraceae bacterium OM1]
MRSSASPRWRRAASSDSKQKRMPLREGRVASRMGGPLRKTGWAGNGLECSGSGMRMGATAGSDARQKEWQSLRHAKVEGRVSGIIGTFLPTGCSRNDSNTSMSANNDIAAEPMRVLVIEDNQDLAKLFCDLLEVMGCTTEVALNGKTGLESAKRSPPDLVFCDLRLPGEKDGFAVAAELRATPECEKIPLIAVTGLSGPDEYHRAIQAGFDRVFEKPIKFAQIQE